ncbi:MAG TPA: 5'/3'-nucleotidase SurE [Myxococcaceae bacterium]|nr:5'/3'-nucleotidase SurE [Myxococcaceae bacterium]
MVADAHRPVILVSNDDGIHAEGLRALQDAVSELGEVWVVAPESEQSATSHAISLHRPLRIREMSERRFAIDGTPADCSYVAVNHLLKDRKPALMVSGINHGANLADDVTYSGTVAAAMEASLLGIPAIAFSLVSSESFDFAPAVRFARALARSVLGQRVHGRLLLNVNVPTGCDPTSYSVTQLGKHSYGYDVVENVDPRGRKYYWIGGTSFHHEDIPGSDCNAVFREKRISVTPLHLDLTEYSQLDLVRSWPVSGYARVEQ